MSEKILVAYASRAGSTGEIAEAIGKVLCQTGASVDVRQVKDVIDLNGYSAVVVGSAIYMGGWMSEATKFIEKHRQTLSQIPVATFTICMMMINNPEEHQQLVATRFTESEQLPRIQPISNGLFAGRIELKKLSLLYRNIAKMVGGEERDSRDWTTIRVWAGDLAPYLIG